MRNKSITWPRKGDKVFKPDIDWWHNACLNYVSDQWNLYALGYKLAGDIIFEYVKETRRDQDKLVFPIVFLYRQFLELRLKELIKKGNILLKKYKEFPKQHNLDILWLQCKKILMESELIDPQDKHDLDAVEECIHQFSEKDPYSMSFRYPTDKKNRKSLPGLTHINLRNLSEIVGRVSLFLDGASTAFDYYLDSFPPF